MIPREEAGDRAGRIVQAAEWHMRLRDAEAESSPEFETWLSEPANARAWEKTAALWGLLGEHARAPEMVAAREDALGAARRSLAQQKRGNGRRWRMAAAGLLIVAAAAAGAYAWHQRPDDYLTAFGERRVITLADGSRVSLDSDSEVTVRYAQSARELHLLRGQARFDVAHDVERPFSVLAGNQKVIATGTAFNVDMTQGKVLVTLIEGHVTVLDEDDAPKLTQLDQSASPRHASVQLEAGQQLVALPQKLPEVETANIPRVTAWISGQLIFSNEPLSEVVARVSRYSKTPIVISDPRIGQERISGVFNTGDVSGFLDMVTHYYPVTVSTDGEGRIVLKKV